MTIIKRTARHHVNGGLVILFLGLLLAACDSPGSETANKPKSTEAEITSFNFGSIIGVWSADRKTLRFTFTKGTDVKNLPVKVVGLSAGEGQRFYQTQKRPKII